MLSSFFRLPASTALCGASLCSAAVLLLQNVPACARWVEEHELAASCPQVQASVLLLQRVSGSICLPALNQAELSLADSASLLLEQPIGEIDSLSLPQPLPDTSSPASLSQEELPSSSCDTPPAVPQDAPPEPSADHLSNCEVSDAQPNVCPTTEVAETASKPEVVPADEDVKPAAEPDVGSADGDAGSVSKPEVCSVGEGTEPVPEPEVESAAESTETAPKSEVVSAGEDAEPTPEPARECDTVCARSVFPSLFTPSPSFSVPPKFSFFLPRASLSPGALRWSILDVRVAAPRLASTQPPKVPAPESVMGGDSGQPESAVAGADAEPKAPPAAQEPLPEGATTPPVRCRIVMVGDSLMEALGPMTHRAMSHRKGLEFIISARYSTGLCRPDYFNWPEHLADVVRDYKPDLAIFFLGANDGMPVLVGKHYVPVGSNNWRDAYAAKMSEMVDIVRRAGADIIWVELPSASPKFNKHLSDTRQVQHSFCESHGISILHTDLIFSGEEGRFEPYGDFHGRLTRLRRKDLVHLTDQGNQKLIEHLLPLIEQHLYSFYTAHPERRLSQEELAKINRVPAVFTCRSIRIPHPTKPPRTKRNGRAPASPHRTSP